jgi:hypothetical protein
MFAPPNRGSFISTHVYGTHVPVKEPSTASFSELCAAKKLFGGVLVQAGALLINHIAPRRRTLTPSA